jgi:3-oxoacyl-[acyl-carrier protein] reductase
MLLKGKKALITGGSRGIGKSIVEKFLQEGADVWFVSTKESPYMAEIEKVAAESGTKVFWKPCNVADSEEVSAVVKEVLEESGGIDTLINNAGITRDGLIFRMSIDNWMDVLNVNLTSAFSFAKSIARPMLKQRQGSIINISSVVGVIGNGGQSNYAASKAGLLGLTKSLARELASRSVRVNAIAPGYIETKMTEELSDEVQEELKSRIPMGRIGKPEEIANAAVFLASDYSSYITGQTLVVDGGMVM